VDPLPGLLLRDDDLGERQRLCPQVSHSLKIVDHPDQIRNQKAGQDNLGEVPPALGLDGQSGRRIWEPAERCIYPG
jgi:hypothetical protein